jgi:predicted transcriptional regulator
MKILREGSGGKLFALETSEISWKDLTLLKGDVSEKILSLLSKKPMYPKEIAKEIRIHEQNVYYYIRKLESANIIQVVNQEKINGTIANYYGLTSDSFFVSLGRYKEKNRLLIHNN